MQIITSADVVPQQPAFYDKIVHTLKSGPAGQLPQEVFHMIVEELPAAISGGSEADQRGADGRETEICEGKPENTGIRI